MTAPPSVQTIIAHHLRALAGQTDEIKALRKRDAAIRALLEADVCPRCGGAGELYGPDHREALEYLSGDMAIAYGCPDCRGSGHPPRASTIAQLVTDASPVDRGLSRQRVDQIVKGRR